MKRKIIQVATAAAIDNVGNEMKRTVVLSDDGIAWELIGRPDDRRWKKLPELPQEDVE